MIPESLSSSLRLTPDLDRWIRIDPGGTVTVFTGKVEIGQGIQTVIAQIAAEELDVSMQRMQVILADTLLSPDEGFTAGSMSTQVSGGAVRQAAAEARHILVGQAAAQLDAPMDRLRVEDGTVYDPETGAKVTYWELMAGKRFNQQVSGRVAPKPAAEYAIVGQPVPRLDIPAKVAGEPVYVDDMDLPGMAHGRVVRPPSYTARLAAIDTAPVEAMPGVIAVVRDGSFLGVIAQREEQAVFAAQRLAGLAQWQGDRPLPPAEEINQRLLSTPGESFLVVDGTPTNDPIPPFEPPASATQTVAAVYSRPYVRHASLGPSSAAAQFEDGKLTVWTHSQGVYPLRADMAQVLDMPLGDIRVIHRQGPGCYGHNGADDVALDAALLARAVPGRPVLVKWSRHDENLWEPFGPAMVMKLQAGLDSAGEVLLWSHETWSYSHSARPRVEPGRSSLLAAHHLARPFAPPTQQPGRGFHGGIHRNADPLYAFPRRRIVKHFVPDSPLRHSALRSLGAFSNIFASESFVDEVAAAAQIDPVAFRLRYLTDPRARDVVATAAERAGWRAEPRPAGRGQGIAFSRYKNTMIYSAVVVEATVDPESGVVHVERAVAAADAGQIINPDGLRNQLEGGIVQSISWTLKEAVQFGPDGLAGEDWTTYPVITFTESPAVDVVLLDRPGEPPLGAGEATVGPAAAALANAIWDATGVRLRQLPFTPERVRQALRAA